MPLRGNTVLPSPDTNTPPVPLDESILLTPDWFDIPKRRCFTPSELARYFLTDAKTITRLIEEGVLRAFPFRISEFEDGERRVMYKIPYRAIVEYFERMQNSANGTTGKTGCSDFSGVTGMTGRLIVTSA